MRRNLLALSLLVAVPDEAFRGGQVPCSAFDVDVIVIGENHTDDAGALAVADVFLEARRCGRRPPECLFVEAPFDEVGPVRAMEADPIELSRFGAPRRLVGSKPSRANPDTLLIGVDVPAHEMRAMVRRLGVAAPRTKESRAAFRDLVVGRNRFMADRIVASGCATGVLLVGHAHVFTSNDGRDPGTSLLSSDLVRRGRRVLAIRARCGDGRTFAFGASRTPQTAIATLDEPCRER